MADLVEFYMVDFNVILGVDLLHACNVSIDCIIHEFRFQIPNETVIELSSSSECLRVVLFCTLRR